MARVTAFRADDEVVLRMLRLRDAGGTAAQIAAATGKNANTVRGTLRRIDAEAAHGTRRLAGRAGA